MFQISPESLYALPLAVLLNKPTWTRHLTQTHAATVQGYEKMTLLYHIFTAVCDTVCTP
jgi:hypothetical protein